MTPRARASDRHLETTAESSAGNAARSVVIIDNYDSYTYNIAQLVSRLTGVEPEVTAVDRFDVSREAAYAAVIVSPGPGHPLTEPAFEVCFELFRRRKGPTLGICLGHQGLIIANGGAVSRTKPAHGVLGTIVHDHSSLFRGVPQGARVVRYHSLAADTVPIALEVTARSADSTVMAVAHRELPHFGVQFHPESILTEPGQQILTNFLSTASIAPVHSPPGQAVSSTSGEGLGEAASHVSSISTWIEPALVATRLLRGQRRAFWLDSAERREWTGRYSIMGYLSDDEPSVVVGGNEFASTGVTPIVRKHFLAHLRTMEAAEQPLAADQPPGTSGWVGVAGYEVQEILPSDDPGSPSDGFFMKVNRAVVFDHDERTVRCSAENPEALAELDAAVAQARQSAAAAVQPRRLTPLTAAPSRRYSLAFDRISQALLDGDSYEAVLTFPLDFNVDGDPLDHYLEIRGRSPAPYAAYLRHADHFVLSASPELMLRVSECRRAEVRPIKGTLPRSEDAELDAIARWRLATDDRFRRENLMIVDLVRNDLGRVCGPGKVHVAQLMAVESYSGVHQLVSSVVGELKPDVSPIDCLRAVFPAGSMTGAPKRRTMELIREVEWRERGHYSGALGWFDGSRAEFSVVIRTLQGAGPNATLNVGGGIIVGSTAEDELGEAMDKARSVTPYPVLTDPPDPRE